MTTPDGFSAIGLDGHSAGSPNPLAALFAPPSPPGLPSTATAGSNSPSVAPSAAPSAAAPTSPSAAPASSDSVAAAPIAPPGSSPSTAPSALSSAPSGAPNSAAAAAVSPAAPPAPPASPSGLLMPGGVAGLPAATLPAALTQMVTGGRYWLPPQSPPATPAMPAPPPGGFDVEAVRREFPQLHREVNGRPLVWLDNGATTLKPRQVTEAVSEHYAMDTSNVHRGAHTLAKQATQVYEEGREEAAKLLGTQDTGEIVFVRGTTEAVNLVAQTWGRANLGWATRSWCQPPSTTPTWCPGS
ncbi:aminotransferase class V-fold PLP-dependent enzyme [Kitasatospora acidiphila]|uniref:aminotransferase class V-fold PLP-dependent enzyme n=1 Tax=Kitasatospora acidiphila TaxID=2567942 RepID=UPI002265D5D2|nr:aminotransferase class V-fold PLP-dependent enzyme [Kitasatospora acidiphila]